MRKGDTPLAYFPLQGLPVGLTPTSRHLIPLSQEQVASPPGTQLLHVARRWRAGDIGSPNRLCSRGPAPALGEAEPPARVAWGGVAEPGACQTPPHAKVLGERTCAHQWR